MTGPSPDKVTIGFRAAARCELGSELHPMETVVVLPRAAPPPAVCFRCGAGAGLALVPCKLRTTPKDSAALDAAQAAGFVIGWLGPVADLVEVARVAHGTREATVGNPLCVSCAAAWRKAKVAEGLAGFGPFLVAVVAILVALVMPSVFLGGGWTRYAVIGVIALLVYVAKEIVPGIVERRMIVPSTCGAVAIDDAAVALSRVHPSAGAAVAAAARAQSTASAPPSRPPSTPSSFL